MVEDPILMDGIIAEVSDRDILKAVNKKAAAAHDEAEKSGNFKNAQLYGNIAMLLYKILLMQDLGIYKREAKK